MSCPPTHYSFQIKALRFDILENYHSPIGQSSVLITRFSLLSMVIARKSKCHWSWWSKQSNCPHGQSSLTLTIIFHPACCLLIYFCRLGHQMLQFTLPVWENTRSACHVPLGGTGLACFSFGWYLRRQTSLLQPQLLDTSPKDVWLNQSVHQGVRFSPEW